MIPCRNFIAELGHIPIFWELILQDSFEEMGENETLMYLSDSKIMMEVFYFSNPEQEWDLKQPTRIRCPWS